MSIKHTKSVLPVAIVAIMMTVAAATANAAIEPTKFVPAIHLGGEVNTLTGGNICLEESKHICGTAKESEQPGGFIFPETVAVAANGNVYVGDNVNHRVQEFTKDGEFVLMFGWNVNKTKAAQPAATQAQRNLCTAANIGEGEECQAGEGVTGERGGQRIPTGLPEQIISASDLAVDQTTGDVYLYDSVYHRVQEFTAGGEFVLMIGGDVNKTKVAAHGSEAEENLCTATEIAHGAECQPGVEAAEGSALHGAFRVSQNSGNHLAVGGPEDLLYVGDDARVQEFDTPDGAWASEISLSALSTKPGQLHASAIAVDPAGDVFVALNNEIFEGNPVGVGGVHEYNVKGELQSTVIDPGSDYIVAMALDAFGRLAISEVTSTLSRTGLSVLYKVTGEEVGELAAFPRERLFASGFAFDASQSSDELYMAATSGQEIEVYAPVVFPKVEVCPAVSVLATSAVLCGEVDPNGVFASAFFEYGRFGEAQSATPVAFEGEGSSPVAYEYAVGGLIPNQTYQFNAAVRAVAEGEEKQAASQPIEFHTLTPPPEIPGAPSSSFVKAQSAVLNALVNPEHATTHYHFEYGICPTTATCALSEATETGSTGDEEYSSYGVTGVTQTVGGLIPGRTYSYRLLADNEHTEVRGGKEAVEGGKRQGTEGAFTTTALPTVQALTGPVSAVSITSAVVSGTVNPEGHPAVYAFELGVYTGAGTQYGVVFSGPAGAGTIPAQESLPLTGLQPGTTYAYRITISSLGYGASYGETQTFTTAGLPAALSVPSPLPQLAVPNVAFPTNKGGATTKKATPKKCAKGKKLSPGRCIKTKAKKNKKTKKAKKSSTKEM